MSPLDDELRAAFRSRVGALEPLADPMAGIEQRARRIRRRRVASSVAGTALAVSVLAVGVPALLTGPVPDRDLIVATQPPSPATTPPAVAGRPANALDWPATPLTDADAAYVREWAITQRSGATPEGEVLHRTTTPLGAEVVAYQLWLPGGSAHTVVAQASGGGPVFLRSSEAVTGQPTVDAVVAGAEQPFVLVVGQPGTTQVQYAADGTTFADAPEAGRAVVLPRTGPTGDRRDAVRLLGPDGSPTSTAPVWVGESEGDPGAPSEAGPANLLTWPTRGAADPVLVREAEAAFARSIGRAGQPVRSMLLFGGEDDAGNAFVLLQAWTAGDDAYTVGYATGPGRAPRVAVRGKTDPDPPVLALLVPAGPEQRTDTLVLVPRPGTGQVLYGPDGSDPRPVGRSQEALDGVVLVDRALDARGDRVVLLDGDGGEPSFDGQVVDLLCTLDGCG